MEEENARKACLLKERSYCKREPFEAENLSTPPTLSDLAPPPPTVLDKLFVSTPANILYFTVAYLSFPFVTHFLQGIVTTSESRLDEILATFTPGISILYGTFVSLTLSTLYNRQRTIQDNVAVESSLLTVMMRNLFSLFRTDDSKIVVAGQCVADQIRTLVRSSRGEELMLLMYNDPYARMLELIDVHENDIYGRNETTADRFQNLISFSRDTARELTKYRAKRLSDETLALPPTHYFILNILTALILLGYALSVVPTIDAVTGAPPVESSILFGSLTSIYILFYNFADDLNNPFQGVYQIRRSCAASHLLQAKWVIANHPLLRGQVDFEEVQQEEDGEVLIRSPGLGDFWFQRDQIYLYQEGEDDLIDPRMPMPK
jgi:hypothetical protein